MKRNFLLIVAVTTVFEGLRAGGGVFRTILDLPARASVGAVAFAEFSRATDLSTRGVVYYVLFGFGGLLLTAASWIVAVRSKAPRFARRLTAAACVSSLAILAMTTQAAPLMFRIGSSAKNCLPRASGFPLPVIACVRFSRPAAAPASDSHGSISRTCS